MVNDQTLQDHPEVYDACMELQFAVSDAEMQELNYRGAQNGEKPYDIAHSFLVEKGLIQE